MCVRALQVNSTDAWLAFGGLDYQADDPKDVGSWAALLWGDIVGRLRQLGRRIGDLFGGLGTSTASFIADSATAGAVKALPENSRHSPGVQLKKRRKAGNTTEERPAAAPLERAEHLRLLDFLELDEVDDARVLARLRSTRRSTHELMLHLRAGLQQRIRASVRRGKAPK